LVRAHFLAVLAVVAAVLVGCGGSASVAGGYVGRASSTAAGATSATGGAVGVNVQSNPATAALLGIIIIGVAMSDESGPIEQRETLAPSPRHIELDERRKVREVDCSKPIEDYSANIRCK
jgi:hypothetical protein